MSQALSIGVVFGETSEMRNGTTLFVLTFKYFFAISHVDMQWESSWSYDIFCECVYDIRDPYLCTAPTQPNIWTFSTLTVFNHKLLFSDSNFASEVELVKKAVVNNLPNSSYQVTWADRQTQTMIRTWYGTIRIQQEGSIINIYCECFVYWDTDTLETYQFTMSATNSKKHKNQFH